jgi:hypothetical protein
MENQALPNPIPASLPHEASAPTNSGRAEAGRNRPVMVWTGRVLAGLFALFMLGASATPKLLQLPVAEATMAELGWPPGYVFAIGILEVACVLLYLFPRTSIFGAVLTMGLLGGAMATQMRAQMPLFSHVLFSVYVGLFMWGGLWLRSPRLRALFPIVSSADQQHPFADRRTT